MKTNINNTTQTNNTIKVAARATEKRVKNSKKGKNIKKTKKANKKIINWSQYNQSLENRGNFSVLLNVAYLNKVPPRTSKTGHPVEYSDAIILFLAQLREFMQMPIRQTIGMAKFIFARAGLDIKLPSRTTLSRRLGELRAPTYLERIEFSSPIIFLPDSTGLKISGEGEWKVRKHGADNRREWVKVHLEVDYSTGAIVASSITAPSADDGHELPALLDQVEDSRKDIASLPEVSDVIADGAYDQHKLYVKTESKGISLLVPPPKNAIWHGDIKDGNLVDDPGWETRNSYVRGIISLGRDEWKNESGYHKRSLAETAMYRLKCTFGPKLKSRKPENQVVETNIRVSLLNLFTSYGRPAYAT